VVEVSLAVELPDKVDLDGLEPMILEAGRRAMAEALRGCCREYEARVTQCPYCGGSSLQGEGSDCRVLLLSFGRVEVALRQLRCEECERRFRPADPLLACLEGANVSGKLREVAVLAGSSWPYLVAARVLRELCGARISAEKLRQLTVEAGRRQAERELALAQEAVSPTGRTICGEGEGDLGSSEESSSQRADLLLVGLDGGWVPSREGPGGMEGKVGVIATEIEEVGSGRHRLSRRRYVATFGEADRLGLLSYRAARGLGGLDAESQQVLGDGAGWIKSQAEHHFPEATCVLDWPHPSRAIHKAIRAARSGGEHKELRRQMHRAVPEHLWHGDVDGAIGLLSSLRPPEGREPVRALEEAISYLDNQRDWLHDYQALRDAGCPVGSGMVERAVEMVINRRLKKRGMRWRRANADAVVSLRVKTINQDWDEATSAQRAA
jgi:hypothetical protein